MINVATMMPTSDNDSFSFVGMMKLAPKGTSNLFKGHSVNESEVLSEDSFRNHRKTVE